MSFDLLIHSAFQGDVAYWQLIRRQDKTDNPIIPFWGTQGRYDLDNTSPYGLIRKALPSINHTLEDGPTSIPGVRYIEAVTEFKSYLRFRPDVGDPQENIFITLARVDWSWIAVVERIFVENPWEKKLDSCPPPLFFQTDEEIEWKQVFKNLIPTSNP